MKRKLRTFMKFNEDLIASFFGTFEEGHLTNHTRFAFKNLTDLLLQTNFYPIAG